MSLLVALDNDGNAEGSLFWDDGVSIGKYYIYIYLFSINFMAYTNVFNLKKSLKLLDTVEKSDYLLASLSVTQVNKISFMLQTIQKRERMFFL